MKERKKGGQLINVKTKWNGGADGARTRDLLRDRQAF
jgi:hypothetical protein